MSDENKFDPNKFSEDLRDRIHRDINGGLKARPVRPFGGGLVAGAVLTLVGLALLLDHLRIISFDRLWQFWPMLLVLVGISHFINRERRRWGMFLMIMGAFLQLNQLGIVHFQWGDLWPFLLIASGLFMIWGSLGAKWAKWRPAFSLSGDGDPRTTLNEVAIFGGIERRVTTQDFQGGHINAVFGGVEIDLTDANMQAEEATLEINAIFGGVELRVPETWQVAFRGTPIFGGIADKTLRRGSQQPAVLPTRVLVLTGAVIFGGVEIKN